MQLPFFFILLYVSMMFSCCGTKKAQVNYNNKPSIDTVGTNTVTNKQPVKKTDSLLVLNNTETKQHTPKKNLIVFEKYDHTLWNNLLQENVSQQGIVNYKAFLKNQSNLKKYIQYLGENLPNNTWSKNDKLAYWINAYNAFTIDLILKHYPIHSIKNINNPWKQRFWKLGDKWYHLDEIEHQILRKMNEPRIHFAIVCASISCPKLLNQAYTANQLEKQLTQATQDFLADTNKNQITSNELKLSKIFKWFATDFKQNGSIIPFLNTYTQTPISPKASISYKTYNWNLNE